MFPESIGPILLPGDRYPLDDILNNIGLSYAFMKTDGKVSLQDRMAVILGAVKMPDDMNMGTFETETCVASIKKEGYGRLHMYHGTRYTAQVETHQGLAELEFLVYKMESARSN